MMPAHLHIRAWPWGRESGVSSLAARLVLRWDLGAIRLGPETDLRTRVSKYARSMVIVAPCDESMLRDDRGVQAVVETTR